MLPKKFKLNPAKFYQNPKKSQKFYSFFGVFYFKPADSNPRFAIIVPASLDKRAVYRHKTKRIIIEAIRKCLTNLSGKAEVLVRAKKILKKQDRLLVEEETKRVFREAGLLQELKKVDLL